MNEACDPDRYQRSRLEQDARWLFEALDGCALQAIPGSGNRFVWNSLTEQTPRTPRALLQAIARLLSFVGKTVFDASSVLSSEEDRGAILAAAVQQQLPRDLPLALSRWVTQPKAGRPSIPLHMEYADAQLHFDGLTGAEGTETLGIVDDLISTGGTMVAQCEGIFEQTRHHIAGVVLVADKGYGGLGRLREALRRMKGDNGRVLDPVPKTLAQLDLSGDRSEVTELHFPLGTALLDEIRADIGARGRRHIDNHLQVLLNHR